MIVCKRCHGYVDTTHHDLFDPSCVNCGCSYPELGPSANGTSPRKQLKETIRYTGNIPRMKELLAYITYSQHPSRITVSPKLTVQCPMCTEKIEVLTALADPSISHRDKNLTFINGYKTARNPITCPEGHSLKLKIDREGTYSWE